MLTLMLLFLMLVSVFSIVRSVAHRGDGVSLRELALRESRERRARERAGRPFPACRSVRC
jgi:hypothetical protein